MIVHGDLIGLTQQEHTFLGRRGLMLGRLPSIDLRRHSAGATPNAAIANHRPLKLSEEDFRQLSPNVEVMTRNLGLCLKVALSQRDC